MIVCLCKGVNDRQIKSAVKSGANSLEKIAKSCQAGTGCGSCHFMLCEMIQKANRQSVRCSLKPLKGFFRTAESLT